MRLVDANLLIYAYNERGPEHDASYAWLQDALSRPEPVRLSWTCILAFLRLTTDPRVFARPLTIVESGAIVTEQLARPAVDILEPTPRHWQILQDLLTAGRVRGPMVTDAHVAALAIEHGATLYTTDRDFARFPGLRWINPLE